MPNPPDLVSTTQACEILDGLHPSTISRWVQLGQLVPAMRVGERGAFLFRRRDIERLAKRLATARAP